MKFFDADKPFLYLLTEWMDLEYAETTLFLIPRGMDLRQEAREWVDNQMEIDWSSYMSFRIEDHPAVFDSYHPMFRVSGWHHMPFTHWLLHHGAEIAGNEYILQISGEELASC